MVRSGSWPVYSLEDLATVHARYRTINPSFFRSQITSTSTRLVQLVTTAPGVAPGPAGSILSGTRPDERRQSANITANGQNERFNNQLVDGKDNNELEQGTILIRPSIDSIAEVHVDGNNYTAETGRTGGAVINLITKSGTNQFYGGVYEFFRNDVLNANDFLNNLGGTSRPEYRQNQFGGSFGGPIKKNKTFFFGDIEELRQIQGQPTGLLATATGFELANPGNFSDVGGPVIPASRLDPVALKYFALLPAANIPCRTSGTTGCATSNYSSNVQKQYYSTIADVRIDHNISDSDSLFARFSYSPVTSIIPTLYPEKNGFFRDRAFSRAPEPQRLSRIWSITFTCLAPRWSWS